MSPPIVYFNRHTEREETECVYGEKPLRWVYGSAPGRVALWLLVRRTFFSRWFGWRMRRRASHSRILPFIKQYKLDPAQFASPVANFRSFDEFFSRKLKADARPIDRADALAVFPADGRHLGFQDASATAFIHAKGRRFDLSALLGDDALAARYQHGALICSRLCPVDYHRFHFPVAGIPSPVRLINGWLYSVNPIALRRNLAYLWENKRAILTLDAGKWGIVTHVIIGATNVGSMSFTYPAGTPAEKGDEMGFFSFGGSFVATLFEPGKITLAPDLLRETNAGRELYAHFGSVLGYADANRS
ncbi:MAG: phosphatidylserine decarboxylase [Puniceicoccales bacterium]|nr:phosphatidylserine decarboxylase [Puniceicoccales bacterium]